MTAKVFLIGDSISLDYGAFLKDFLDAGLHVYGKPGRDEAYKDLDIPLGGNGGDSRMVLEYLQEAKDSAILNCDLFVFNCGLHDIKRSRATGQLQVPQAEYIRNLHSILDILYEQNFPTVFINAFVRNMA